MTENARSGKYLSCLRRVGPGETVTHPPKGPWRTKALRPLKEYRVLLLKDLFSCYDLIHLVSGY